MPIALALAAPAGAPALAATLPMTTLVAPVADVPSSPSVAVDDSGRAVVAWAAAAPARRGVIVRPRPGPRAAFAIPQRIATDPPLPATAPVAAIAPDGRAAVAWRGAAGLRVMVRGRGRTRFTALPAPPASREFISPGLAIAPGGVVVAWLEHDVAGHWTARRATFRLGAWDADPPLDLVADGVVADPAFPAPPVATVSRDGDTAVAWPGVSFGIDPATAVPVRVVVRRWRVGGMPGADRWEAPQTLSAAGHQVAVAAGPTRPTDPAGWMLATWSDGGRLVASVREPTAAGFAPAEPIADVPGGSPFPAAGINEEGYAAVAWGAPDAGRTAIRARMRSGASGLWGPRRALGRIEPDAFLRLYATEVVVDRHRIASVAWPDPMGPGSASVFLRRLSVAGVRGRPAEIPNGENTQDFSLGAGTAGALLVARRTLPDSEPNVELRAAVAGVPHRVALTAARLRADRRLAQDALRRADAALARLRAVRADHIRDGSIGAADLGPAITVSGTASGGVPAGPITPLAVAPAGPGAPVALTAHGLRIGRRIAQAAMRRASAGRQALVSGLGGLNVVDGQITAAKIAPGLTITATAPSARPPVGAVPATGGGPPPRRLPLTLAQLAIAHRIAEEAALRADWLVERLDGGLTGADFRDGGLDPVDLAPDARP